MGAPAKKPVLEEQRYYGGPLDGGCVRVYDPKMLKNFDSAEIVWSVNLDGVKKILISFRGDNYINSAGIAVLISITAESRERQQSIRITGLSPHFQKIFDMVGLTKYVAVFPSEEMALENF